MPWGNSDLSDYALPQQCYPINIRDSVFYFSLKKDVKFIYTNLYLITRGVCD